jgi:hypothetical protein
MQAGRRRKLEAGCRESEAGRRSKPEDERNRKQGVGSRKSEEIINNPGLISRQAPDYTIMIINKNVTN